MIKKTSLYSALTLAVMTTFLLMSYVLLQYLPTFNNEARLLHVPKLTTEVWGVFDPQTGELRYGRGIDDVRPIASVTKLATAFAVMQSEMEDASATITWSDLATDGESGKLKVGETHTLGNLLFPLLVESSNDAGTVIHRVLGKKFEEMMQVLTAEAALKVTTIKEPTGLSKENVSTVRDLAHLYAYIAKQYPHITDITQLHMYITDTTGLINNDPIRSFEGFTGGKNGYTPEAGRTFVGTLKLPEGRGEIGIVLLGSTDLLGDVSSILNSFN